MGAARSPEEIRRSIEANRAELGLAVERLRVEIDRATDWRTKLNENRNAALGGAAGLGWLLGGGIGVFNRLLLGRPKARQIRGGEEE